MQVVLLQDESAKEFLVELATEVAKIVLDRMEDRLSQMESPPEPITEEWVNTREAMKILNIKSTKKMQRLRDERDLNGIVISEMSRPFQYQVSSLLAYREKYIS